MKKATWVLGVLAVAALAGGVAFQRGMWTPDGVWKKVEGLLPANNAAAQARRGPPVRTVPVEVATVVKKKVPVQLEALGSVTPIATVVIKPRVDSMITEVHFTDGATVNQGDILFTLDSRGIEAQIRQAEGLVARDQAQLEGAERDVRRYTDLVAKSATPVTNLDNAKTQAATFQAQKTADQASLDNLRVQLSYCTIRAPISGRISAATVKVGNVVRAGSDTVQLATINQISPIYVSFTVPQRSLPDVRQALNAKTATVAVTVPGESKQATGRVAMIENMVDSTTGMVTVRAAMPNADQLLWPGTLVTTKLQLRVEDAVTVPEVALQVSQAGTYVFVIKDGVAKVRPVTVDRTLDQTAVIAKGVAPGEAVVTDGQLLLSDGTKVAVRGKPAGA